MLLFWGRKISGKGNSKCKGPEAGACQAQWYEMRGQRDADYVGPLGQGKSFGFYSEKPEKPSWRL